MLKDSESRRFHNYFLIGIIVIVNSLFWVSIIKLLFWVSIVNFLFRDIIIGLRDIPLVGLLLLLIINLCWVYTFITEIEEFPFGEFYLVLVYNIE